MMEPLQTKHNLIGAGIYSLADTARYLRVSEDTVARWAVGRLSRKKGRDVSERRRTSPVLVAPVQRVDRETVLSFAQLIELRMVNLFRRHGVSMPVIRAAAQKAAQLLQTDHPFSSARLHTDGKSIFAELSYQNVEQADEDVKEEKVVQDLQQLQVVIGDIARAYFKDTEYNDVSALRWWLLGTENERAVLDPTRGFGQPLDHQTGVPLDPLYKAVMAGDDAATVADWYGVPRDAVDAAVQFYTYLKMK